MARRFNARACAGVAGAAAMLMMAAAVPASADAANGVVDGGTPGLTVNVGSGSIEDVSTNLIGFRLSDGTELGVYCVEFYIPIDRERPLVEKDWDNHPNADSAFRENRDQINFILHNSFPVTSTDDLATQLADNGATLTDGLSAEEAIAATQSAIWHFSDDVDLNRQNPVPGDASSGDDVLALYDHLTGENNVGLDDQPSAALKVDPTELSGTAGERIGPFTVSTNGEIAAITPNVPEGVRVTDADGAELDAGRISDASQLFLDVPAETAAGSGSVELTATATVGTGRLFVGKDYDGKPTQSVIVATAEESEVTATASGIWDAAVQNAEAAPEPQAKNADDDLAETGASILAPALIGAALVGAGILSLLFLRHRRRA